MAAMRIKDRTSGWERKAQTSELPTSSGDSHPDSYSQLVEGPSNRLSPRHRDGLDSTEPGVRSQPNGHREETREAISSASLQHRFREPASLEAQLAQVSADLHQVPARQADGAPTSFYDKLMQAPELSSEQRQRILRNMARAKDFFERAADRVGPDGEYDRAIAKYQEINWLHTYGELDKVLDASRALRLTSAETEDALLASIYSDVDKVSGLRSLVTHHLAGARAAAVYLSRELDIGSPKEFERICRICRYVKDHQISPPEFFSDMVVRAIEQALTKERRQVSPVERAALDRIQTRIADPLNPAHLNAEADEIAFSEDERALLSRVGLREWTVPSERASFAVIAGDAAINYATPDGVAKMVAIRGPGSHLEDQTAQQSVDSVLGPAGSAADARRVLPDDVRPLLDQHLADTRAAVGRAERRIDTWLRSQARDPAATPYWRGSSLRYPSEERPLSPSEREDFAFAHVLRETFERYLRDEHALQHVGR